MKRQQSMTVAYHLDQAESYLTLAARHIDTAGELGKTDQSDMLGCFASNVLEGSRSLIREMRSLARTTKRRSKP